MGMLSLPVVGAKMAFSVGTGYTVKDNSSMHEK